MVQLYERLADEGKAPRYGWSVAKVSYALQIDQDGHLLQVMPLFKQEIRGKKTISVPVEMTVPEQAKRASGICPQFLCDTASYFLGFDNKGKPERTRQCFEAAKMFHLRLLENVDSPAAVAVCNFFKNWSPEPTKLSQNKALEKEWDGLISGGNLIFDFDSTYAQDDEEIQWAWEVSARQPASDENDHEGICLVTGKEGPIARLHPSIKGVTGTQASGGSLISYNKGKNSFESYGKENDQSYNAYVSEYAAFAYTTALNRLLADRRHVKRLGDTTIVYWAEENNDICQDIMASFFDDLGDTDTVEKSTITNHDLDKLFEKIKQGKPIDFEGIALSYDNPFYILGLAPNAARISVRFFLQGTFGDFLTHMVEHADNLKIIKPAFIQNGNISLWQMMRETVNPNSKDKAASPNLTGAVFRSIMLGRPYPEALYENVLLRIKAGTGNSKINYGKAAIIRAYMIKNKRRHISMALDEKAANVPYVLGRLFAQLEKIQLDANPETQATIKDRYFNSACATPAGIFPVLQKLSQHHLQKLPNASKIWHEKQLGDIMDLLTLIDNPFPKQLPLEQQGMFILGYYHQKQKLFEKKQA